MFEQAYGSSIDAYFERMSGTQDSQRSETVLVERRERGQRSCNRTARYLYWYPPRTGPFAQDLDACEFQSVLVVETGVICQALLGVTR